MAEVNFQSSDKFSEVKQFRVDSWLHNTVVPQEYNIDFLNNSLLLLILKLSDLH